MGSLDGVSSTEKKQVVKEKETAAKTKESEKAEEIDVFGNDENGDGVGDKIELNKDNVIETEDGYYVEVDEEENNSLYSIMSNTYKGWDDMSAEEQDALVKEVMNANPEIFGTEVNSASGQYVTDSDRASLKEGGSNEDERLNTIIKAGDKLKIPRGGAVDVKKERDLR